MRKKSVNIIYYNDKFLLGTEKKSSGFYYGLGCYESIRCINNKVPLLELHIKNLENNMSNLGIYRKIDFISIIYEYINLQTTENNEFIINVIVNDIELYIYIENLKADINSRGKYDVKLIDSVYHNEISNYNTINRVGELIALNEIEKEQLDDGIYINRENIITNAIHGNVYFIKNNIIRTPDSSLNIINSIKSKLLEDIIDKLGYTLEKGKYKLNDLIDSDSIFIINIYRKNIINQITSINGIEKITTCEIIKIIKKEYFKLYENMI